MNCWIFTIQTIKHGTTSKQVKFHIHSPHYLKVKFHWHLNQFSTQQVIKTHKTNQIRLKCIDISENSHILRQPNDRTGLEYSIMAICAHRKQKPPQFIINETKNYVNLKREQKKSSHFFKNKIVLKEIYKMDSIHKLSWEMGPPSWGKWRLYFRMGK